MCSVCCKHFHTWNWSLSTSVYSDKNIHLKDGISGGVCGSCMVERETRHSSQEQLTRAFNCGSSYGAICGDPITPTSVDRGRSNASRAILPRPPKVQFVYGWATLNHWRKFLRNSKSSRWGCKINLVDSLSVLGPNDGGEYRKSFSGHLSLAILLIEFMNETLQLNVKITIYLNREWDRCLKQVESLFHRCIWREMKGYLYHLIGPSPLLATVLWLPSGCNSPQSLPVCTCLLHCARTHLTSRHALVFWWQRYSAFQFTHAHFANGFYHRVFYLSNLDQLQIYGMPLWLDAAGDKSRWRGRVPGPSL